MNQSALRDPLSAIFHYGRYCISLAGHSVRSTAWLLFPFFIFLCGPSMAQSLDSADLPVVWLRADTGASSPGLWSDYTTRQHSASAAYGQAPLRNALFNFNPALSFDGIDDYMKISYNAEGLPEITVIAVFKSSDTTETGVWGTENALSRKVLLTTRRAAGPDSAVDQIGKNERFAVLSTVLQSWPQSATLSDIAYLVLGSAGKEGNYKPFKGILAELLVFDKRLDFMTQLQYETYLAIKYGIPLTERNYVNTSRKLLWSAEDNKKFGHWVTGLGKNDAFLLCQKQSRNALDTAGLLTMSIGSLAATNAANMATINNDDYLIWGDNNDTLKIETSANGSLGILKRKWMMNVSGNTAADLKTHVLLDLKQLPPHPKGYWLVIDRSAQSNFNIDQLSYILPDSVSKDSIAVYRNVNWDADRSGKDVFGFAQATGLLALMTVVDTPSCSQPLAGKASIRALGGDAPFSYELVNQSTGKNYTGSFPGGDDSMLFHDLSAGQYALKLHDAEGHEAIRQFNFAVPDPLTVDLGPDRQLTGNQEMVLDATRDIPANAQVRYNWYGANGFLSSQGRITVTDTGTYRVEVTNARGCVFADQVVIGAPGKQKFDVYPSLSEDGNFNVNVLLPERGNVTVTIYDLKGNKFVEMKGRNNSTFHFSGHILMPGVYMVVLRTANGTESRKIIVQ